jgi:hypothetical protein
MIDIITLKGEKYSFDPDTERVFKDGKLIGSNLVEPVYSDFNEFTPPTFSGLWLKSINSILSLSGKINPVITDINSVQ